jgi:hypothetical protein
MDGRFPTISLMISISSISICILILLGTGIKYHAYIRIERLKY